MSTMIAKKIPKFNHEKLLSRIEVIKSTQCWEFKGCITTSGYGQMAIQGGGRYSTHRLSWAIFKGNLESSMVIDHICKNTKCCNPDHLREVTRKINTLENSMGRAAANSVKVQCINGHLFDEVNTYRYSRGRGCKICKVETNRRLRAKNTYHKAIK